MAYPETLVSIGGAAVSMATKKGQDVIDPIVLNVNSLTGAIPTLGFSNYTAGLVVNDANDANSYTPGSGTNPTLGSGSTTVGRYMRIGDLVVANFIVKFGTSGVAQGTGVYRIKLPTDVAATLYNADAVVGWGHMVDAAIAGSPLAAGSHKTVTFHVTSSVHDHVAGIVMGSSTTEISSLYTISNLTTDRTYDANASSTAELADVVGTLIADIDGARGSGAVLDNVAAGIPWAWTASCSIIGCLMYEAG